MNLTLSPGRLKGEIRIPESKSELHRALICAALSGAPSEVLCANVSADIQATADGLSALGASVTYRNDRYYVKGIVPGNTIAQIPCGESGSTLRFLLALAAVLGCGADFFLGDRLENRPVEPFLQLLSGGGCTFRRTADILHLEGKLKPGIYEVETSVSSQYLSGLLMTLPLAEGPEALVPSGEPVSKSYLNLTCRVMEKFGVKVQLRNGAYRSSGIYREVPVYEPEGDWSAAAFWETANALGCEIRIGGLSDLSAQGDRAVTALIRTVRDGGAAIDLTDVPDLLPPLAVLASVTPGDTRFFNAARLREKESDRLHTVCRLIRGLGGNCLETEDGLKFCGVSGLRGGTVDCARDHRIAMAGAIAATVCREPVIICGAECVEKSYPQFWNHYQRLGGKLH